MAMIGRGAAVAEVGSKRWQVNGFPAFIAWLGVHALLMASWRSRVEAVISWTWDYLTRSRGPQLLDRPSESPVDGDGRLVGP